MGTLTNFKYNNNIVVWFLFIDNKKTNHKFRNDSTQINHLLIGLFLGKDQFEYEFEEPYRPYGNSDTSNTALYREISDDTRYKRKPSQESDPYQQKVNITDISKTILVMVMNHDS